MGVFPVPVILVHPYLRGRSTAADLLLDTGASYTLLPPALVARLELPTPEERPAELASAEPLTYRIGEARARLDDRQRTTIFLARPPGSPALPGPLCLQPCGLGACRAQRPP